MANGQPFYNYMGGGYTPYQTPSYNMYANQQPVPSMATMPQNQTFNGFQAQSQLNTQPQSVIPPKTNMPLVTSLTEAMSRTTELNSDTFYADQDKPVLYRVSVDMQGRKTYKTFEIKDVTEQVIDQTTQSSPSNIDLSAYATKADLQAFRDEIMGYAQAFGFNAQSTSVSNTVNPTVTSKPKKVEKIEKAPVKVENEETVKE